jgi:hypothetical protein
MKLTKRHLRRIIKEEFGKLFEAGLHSLRWNVFANGKWQEITLTPDEKQAVDELYDLDVNEEDIVIEVLEQSRGMEIEDVESIRTNWQEI